MDRYLFLGAAVAMMLPGVGMVIMPGRVISTSRDHGDTRPPTAGEIRRTRLAGALVAAASAAFLHDLATGRPGADFLTP
jgi:hypothetical protein